jgi:hypothetical protein
MDSSMTRSTNNDRRELSFDPIPCSPSMGLVQDICANNQAKHVLWMPVDQRL